MTQHRPAFAPHFQPPSQPRTVQLAVHGHAGGHALLTHPTYRTLHGALTRAAPDLDHAGAVTRWRLGEPGTHFRAEVMRRALQGAGLAWPALRTTLALPSGTTVRRIEGAHARVGVQFTFLSRQPFFQLVHRTLPLFGHTGTLDGAVILLPGAQLARASTYGLLTYEDAVAELQDFTPAGDIPTVIIGIELT